jgi:peptidoglycan/xylan/chitin deacetylase (PgdA/CDA1 family)
MTDLSASRGVPEAGGAVSRLRRGALRVAAPLLPSVGSLVAVRTDAPHAVLTFDDGPEPGGTDAVLASLAEHGATATFFVLVGRARRHPRLLADVLAAGHEIGLHGMDHRRLTSLNPDTVRTSLAAAHAELEDMVGAPVRWFRPPYGAQTLSVWRAIQQQGLIPVLWGPCAWDWLPRPTEQLAATALRGLDRGAILLSHDGFAGPDEGGEGGEDGPPRIDRRDLVTRVITGLAGRGLTGRSLSEVLRVGRARTVPWFRR